jgi:hypothetical protein
VRTLGYEHTERLLIRLGDLAEQVVLVGGQAVNFWAQWYRGTASTESLEACAPFTSKDVDIAAERKLVERLAERLQGRSNVATFDTAAPQAGTIVYVDDDGTQRTLDVMATLTGVEWDELTRTRIPIEYVTASGVALRFTVMHPVLMLESRASNVLEHATYRTDHGVRQLRAAVICARQYLADMSQTDPKGVLKWNERIFRFRVAGGGRRIATDFGVNVFEAVATTASLPENFLTIRYPQMVERVAALKEAGS